MNNVINKTKIQETINEIYNLLDACINNINSLEESSKDVKNNALRLDSYNGKRVLESNTVIETSNYLKKGYEKFVIKGADTILTHSNIIIEEVEDLKDKISLLTSLLNSMEENLAIITIYIVALEKAYAGRDENISFLSKLTQACYNMELDATRNYRILHAYSVLETGTIDVRLYGETYNYTGSYLKYYNENGFNIYAPLAKVQALDGKYNFVSMSDSEMESFANYSNGYYSYIMNKYDSFTPKMKDYINDSLKNINLVYIDYDKDKIDSFNWNAFATTGKNVTIDMNTNSFSYIANETFPHELGHIYDYSTGGYIENGELVDYGQSDTKIWTNIYNQLKEDASVNSYILDDYALSKPEECFADSVSAYYNRPEDLKEVEINIDGYNNLYDYIDDVLNY